MQCQPALAVVALLPPWYHPLHALDIHVDTRGRDDHSGTQSEPLATLQGAQKSARKRVAQGLKDPVNVNSRSGKANSTASRMAAVTAWRLRCAVVVWAEPVEMGRE